MNQMGLFRHGGDSNDGTVDYRPRLKEIQSKWGVLPGDIFNVSGSLLMCADSLAESTWTRIRGLVDTIKIGFTSPPYSTLREYNSDSFKATSPEELSGIFAVSAVDTWCVNLGLRIQKGEVITYWNDWIESAHKSGLKLLAWNVWDRKNPGGISAQVQMFGTSHEWVFVFGRDAFKLNRTVKNRYNPQKGTKRDADGVLRKKYGDVNSVGTTHSYKNMSSVFTFPCQLDRNTIARYHPAVFPVDLPKEYIKAMTDNGDFVVDPFCGSATTILACVSLGRRGIGIDINPEYISLSLERLSKEAGMKVERVS